MTTQAQDILHYNGTQYYLTQELLEGYFNEYPDKRLDNSFECTAMWRGYIAEFEIKDNQLFVLNSDYELGDLFPNNGKYEWYSGLIRIDPFRGEFDHEPENGIFEFLEIANGNLIQKRTFNYEQLQQFKKQQFEYYLISDDINTVYEFWKTRNINNRINIEQLNKIIEKDILKYLKHVID